MYQFNSEIDKLLTNLNRRKPNTTGLFRGGGLPKGGGLSNSRGGGIPRMRSGIPDGGFKTRPKTIRDEMQRTDDAALTQGPQDETKSGSDNESVSGAASDADSDSDRDAAAAVLSGKNSALGQSGQPKAAKPASSGQSSMTPASKAAFDKAVAGVADNSKTASREDVTFFVRPAGEHSWLHLGAGNKNARTVFGNFIGQPKAVTPWHFQGGGRAHGHLKPRNLKGALQGYAIMAIKGDQGRKFAQSRQTAAEWKVQQRGSGWTPPTKQLARQPEESKGSSSQRQLNMGGQSLDLDILRPP